MDKLCDVYFKEVLFAGINCWMDISHAHLLTVLQTWKRWRHKTSEKQIMYRTAVKQKVFRGAKPSFRSPL